MQVVLVGLSYRTAPVGVLEQLTVPPGGYAEVLKDLLDRSGLPEAVLLHTCNRAEFYAAAEDPCEATSRIVSFIQDLASVRPEELEPRLYKFTGEKAVRHLLSVAASLDSMVLGETQIQSQVKDALMRAAGAEAAGPVLRRLFNAALGAGKRVRTETDLGEMTVSISSTAVELAGRAFGGLEGHSALVVGAGETAELAMPHLKSGGVDPVYVGSRTMARAETLAGKFDARPVPFHSIGEALAGADIVLVATGAPHYVIHWPEIEEAMFKRNNRPVFIIDMSVPRNVDPVVGDIPNVHLCNIDDLEEVAAANRAKRAAAVAKALLLIEEAAEKFDKWNRGLEVVPTLVSLRDGVERIRAEEEAKALKKLGHLSEKDREIVREFGRALANKVLHGPSVRLKEDMEPGLRARLLESIRVLFGLGGSEDGEAQGKDGGVEAGDGGSNAR
jgi:glutamyl-tRNA reductase